MAIVLNKLSPQALLQPNGVRFEARVGVGVIERLFERFSLKVQDGDRPDGLNDELWDRVKRFRHSQFAFNWLWASLALYVAAATYLFLAKPSKTSFVLNGIALCTATLVHGANQNSWNFILDHMGMELRHEFGQLANKIEVNNWKQGVNLAKHIAHLAEHYLAINHRVDVERILGPLNLKLCLVAAVGEFLSSVESYFNDLKDRKITADELCTLHAKQDLELKIAEYLRFPNEEAVKAVREVEEKLVKALAKIQFKKNPVIYQSKLRFVSDWVKHFAPPPPVHYNDL